MTKQIVAFSGGKDSTALVLRMAELGEDFSCLFTPTGDELPELEIHLHSIMDLIGKELITPPNQSLLTLIDHHQALPNFRMRWCTRQIKIEPCIAYLVQHPGSTLVVGLRADEESRVGLYGDYATYRYPMREWGWGIQDVWNYLDSKGVHVPRRTDCALCYGQRLAEWYRLWRDHPDRFEQGVQLEAKYKHTFRSAQRDSYPAGLKYLREVFIEGVVPKHGEDEDSPGACRVCSL